MSDGQVTYEIRADDSSLTGDLQSSENKVEKSASSMGDKFSGAFKGAGLAIGASFLAVGAAAIGIGVSAVSSANDMDKAMNQFIATTGLATEGTDYWQKSLENIYADNYGEDFNDIANSMAEVKNQLGALDEATLTKLTESAFTLKDTFGYEVPESVRSANTMMQQFGLTGDEAFNLITKGAQSGLDFSGELMDSINEYSVQFGKVGLSAEDMFDVFQSGKDAGAFNLDKIGDAVKEFSIRAVDGSTATADGFSKIGLNADEMTKKFASGGDTAKEAFYQVINGLKGIEDPVAQGVAGVDLFGTMWEDLGPKVVTSLGDLQGEFDKTEDSMGKLKKVKYDDLGSMFEGLKRSVELLLLPLGEMLIPVLDQLLETLMPFIEEYLPPLIELIGGLLSTLMPLIGEILPPLIELFGGLFEQLAPLIQEALPPLIAFIGGLIEQLMPLIQQVLPIVIELFEKLMPPIMQIIQALLPPLIELISALLPIFQVVIDLLMPIIDLFIDLLDPIVNLISNALVPLVNALMPIISTLADLLIPQIKETMKTFSDVFSVISFIISNTVQTMIGNLNGWIDFITGVFTGNWSQAWKGVKEIFGSIIGGIGNLFKAPLNAMIDGINSFIKSVGQVKIPDWVPGVGGKGIDIPLIPRLKKGKAFVPNDYYPAFLDYGERVLTQEQNAKFNVMGGIDGMEMALSGGVDNSGVNSNTNINADVSLSTEDINRLCGAIEKIENTIDLDGEKVGKVLAPRIDKNLGTTLIRKKRGG